MDQEHYAIKVLQKFNMENCKKTETPMATGVKFCNTGTTSNNAGEQSANKSMSECSDLQVKEVDVPYREAIGSLMYLMTCTRPDLASSLQILSRFMTKPAKEHWEGVKRVLRYLKGTKSHGILFKKSGFLKITGFFDVDWGGCVDTRRSTSGYVFSLCGGAVSWSSKRQNSVALSSCESECMSATHAAKEAVWQRNIVRELISKNSGSRDVWQKIIDRKCVGDDDVAIDIYIDNQSAIELLKNPKFHARSKHIDIQLNFVRELIDENRLNFIFIATEFQVADILTKSLPKDKTIFCRTGMGIVEPQENLRDQRNDDE